MQSGELTVTGRDHVKIILHKFPTKVIVKFKDHVTVVPCNPHHHDELTYEVHRSFFHHSGFELKIFWCVSGVREIVWYAYY